MIVSLFDATGLSHPEAAKSIPCERQDFYESHSADQILPKYRDRNTADCLRKLRSRVNAVWRAVKLKVIVCIDNWLHK